MKILRRIDAWLRQRKVAAELAEEMETHRLLTEEEHRRAGLENDEARWASQRTMGNAVLMAEESRSVWLAPWLEAILQDLRYGVRGLFHNRTFALTAIASLGLAIGFNTSFFTVFNAVALRPWPVVEPERMVSIWEFRPKVAGGRAFSGSSPAEGRFLNESAKTLSGVLVQRGEQVQIGEAVSKPRPALIVSDNYFRVLGVPMAAGRGFLEGDASTPQMAAVLSYEAWTNRFGSDPAIVGKSIKVNGVTFWIAGVTAEEFPGTLSDRLEVYLPLSSLAAISATNAEWARKFVEKPTECCASLAGRLAEGMSQEQAQAELDSLHKQFQRMHGLDESQIRLRRTAFISPNQSRKMTPLFVLFFLAVTFVLFLACANVANLTLARAAARQREIGIRLSIGASRSRVIRQLLTESFLIASISAVIGIGISMWLPGAIFEYGVSENLSFIFKPDWTVLLYTLVVAALTALLSGLAPALHATRGDRTRLIHGTPAAVTGRFSLRGVMLGAQVALSVVLLCGSFLLLRAIDRARSIDLGFRVAGISQAQLMLPLNTYRPEAVGQLMDNLGDIWSSRTLAVTNNPPLSSIQNSWGVTQPGARQGEGQVSVRYYETTPGFFDVLQIPVVKGRAMMPSDRGRHVMVINERLAEKFWRDGNPIGQTLMLGESPYEVVGVVRDAMIAGPGEVEPIMFLGYTGGDPYLLWASGSGDSAVWQTQLQRVDSRLRLESGSLVESRKRWLRGSELSATLAGGLGAFALVLAAVGIFGTFSFAVEQRRQEIGIRMSLGARGPQLLRLLLFSSGRSVIAGLVLGLLAAGFLSRLLAGQLYGLSPLDPISYIWVVCVLVSAALVATWSPARRAASVDPLISLRCE